MLYHLHRNNRRWSRYIQRMEKWFQQFVLSRNESVKLHVED